ncbi:Ig-like domain-containing protein [Carboxylicivirga sp. M1479]|uniref:Ig-like domain-containing protein n=1 Tax=Carboxylicivirga sp. M1479 TaxID=2594476 RepID=UPI00163D9226|nr:Ig-like domain-containing protein [Carboxylicivirga sp. M1479]
MNKIGLILLISWVSLLSYAQPFDHTPSSTIVYREINISETIRRHDPDLFVNIDIDDDGTNDLIFRIASEADNIFIGRVYASNEQANTKFLSGVGCSPTLFSAFVNKSGQKFIEQSAEDWNGSVQGAGETQVIIANNFCTDEPNFLNKDFSYLGVQFEKDGNIHYAWLLIKIYNIKDVTDYMSIEVKSLAYETVASQGIQAGDDGNPVVSSIEIQGAGGISEITEDYGTLQMEANLLPIEAQGRLIHWTLSDYDLATINIAGELTALSNGTVRVYATIDDINQKTDYADITISNQKIHLEALNVLVKGGGEFKIDTDYGTLEFDVEFIPENADNSFKSITWEQSNNASNNQFIYGAIGGTTGIVQAINDADGLATNTTFTAQSSDPNGTSKDFSVVISNQTKRIARLELVIIGELPPEINQDKGMLQLRSNDYPSYGEPIFWKVDNPSLASVTPDVTNSSIAFLNALNDGTVNVICYWEDPSVSGRIVSDTLSVLISNQIPTAIDELLNEQKAILFPNPANSNSTVFINTKKRIQRANFRTISGKFVASVPVSDQTLQLTDIKKGTYLVTLHLSNNTYFTKLLYVE